MPYGFPALDAELTEALDDLTRLDAAIEAMHSGDPHRDGDTVPGYDALEEARNAALDRLVKVRARGMPGLQAKAHAILADSVTDHLEDIASSLARDLIGARPSKKHHSDWTDDERDDPVTLCATLAHYQAEGAFDASWEAERRGREIHEAARKTGRGLSKFKVRQQDKRENERRASIIELHFGAALRGGAPKDGDDE